MQLGSILALSQFTQLLGGKGVTLKKMLLFEGLVCKDSLYHLHSSGSAIPKDY